MSKIEGRFIAFPRWFLEAGNCSGSQALVLLALQSFAGAGGIYPSYEALAKRAGISRRSAVSAVASLVEAGVLVKQSRSNERGHESNSFTIIFDQSGEICTSANDGFTSAKSALPSAKKDRPSAKSALPLVQNLHPNLERTLSRRLSKDNPISAPEAQDAFDVYNQAADQAGWTKAISLSKPRAAKLKARLADAGGLDGWCDALQKAAGNTFMAGDNERGWRADLDFFLQQKSFTKLIEGSYDRQPTSNSRAANGRSSGPHAQLFEAAARVADREQRGEF